MMLYSVNIKINTFWNKQRKQQQQKKKKKKKKWKEKKTVLFYITKTRLYYVDPLQPHHYIVNLGFTGVYIIILISA